MEDYKVWLKSAKDDLLWTKHNISAKIYYGACFTSQQASEKALKGYLLLNKKRLRKIHDLRALLEDSISIDKSFEKLRKEAAKLNSYYIETRYPTFEAFSPFTKDQAEEALDYAEKIVDFIEKKLNKQRR
ncbi:hypothetical protein A3A46_02910 [Candidatus Roizmanbacteria bacterium RIFCSPLOWO2_01_FULL_37_13]|uniref:HEPN domain-containing protein n=1 Tax=Candidatus Roizmanbacteria bacterium RIFCSPHIGHO2_02_FULL_38_11 TaxID=1802039 RepID=A0A1F7H2I4_9BACT|nr:MAG: hypothetical protein A3C25_00010 [Candidatus Roizmanbacteria bacterium RIFCSPHIGHO2_02_FULL_38_11]OGK34260.1 MAG: hypothetical protein A3F58_02865 [Candidatus Roizmanbacteria bacterium RIFCSPHIGHO2_12_FULL_37_9b]OGK43073.1 MAG: hypothetical protein A3A46_02910 [Candidatus Roizmanbacteria bacterium RIFCSPLOWO2_01_FULL_37_13]